MISINDVRKLLSFENGNHRVCSLTLNVDGRRFPKRQEYLVEFKNLVKEAEEGLGKEGISSEALESIQKDFQKMESYLENEFQRGQERSVMIFSCSAKGLWQTFAFPVPLRSSLAILPRPYTRHLTSLLDQYKRYCTVLISKEQAKIFDVYQGEIQDRSEIFEELPGKVRYPSSKEYKSGDEYGLSERRIERRSRRSGNGISGGEYGLGENRVERHVADHVRRHLHRIAQMTFSFFQEDGFDYLIIGGQEEIVSQFEPMLHSYLQPRVAGRIKADPKFPLSEVLEEALQMVQSIELDHKYKLLRRIADGASQQGLGVLGIQPTLDALAQGAIHTLAVFEGANAAGARCPSCGYLNLEQGPCPHCRTETETVPDLIEEAVEEAILEGAEIVYLPQHPLLENAGGIGGLLRFQPAKQAGGFRTKRHKHSEPFRKGSLEEDRR